MPRWPSIKQEKKYMGVSKNSGTPKIIHFNRVFLINHPFLGTPIFGNTHIIINIINIIKKIYIYKQNKHNMLPRKPSETFWTSPEIGIWPGMSLGNPWEIPRKPRRNRTKFANETLQLDICPKKLPTPKRCAPTSDKWSCHLNPYLSMALQMSYWGYFMLEVELFHPTYHWFLGPPSRCFQTYQQKPVRKAHQKLIPGSSLLSIGWTWDIHWNDCVLGVTNIW